MSEKRFAQEACILRDMVLLGVKGITPKLLPNLITQLY